MDFLTLFPYVGIIALVIINALLVNKQDVTVDDKDHTPEH